MVNFSIKKHSQRFVNALSAWTGLGEIRYRFQSERLGLGWDSGTAGLDFLGLSMPPFPHSSAGQAWGVQRSWMGYSSYSQ